MRLDLNQATEKDISQDARMDRLALVAVQVGLRLQMLQELIITAPMQAAPLVRKISARAYEEGASLVTVLYTDEAAVKSRFMHGFDGSFDVAATWLHSGLASAYRNGAARLAVGGNDPLLLADFDSDKVSRVHRATASAHKEAMDIISSYNTNWSIVCASTPAWARLVFPYAEERQAVDLLWDEIFRFSRVDDPNPIESWKHHNADLKQKCTRLTGKQFSSLHFVGPGTDLIVGLADEHIWLGGEKQTKGGGWCNPNIPSEEIFTAPHREKVFGYARATKPLLYQGTSITNMRMSFEEGRVVECFADHGQEVIRKALSVDQGANRLGEVALVPHSSQISSSNLLFYNTLLDENAACHIALGQSYRSALKDGRSSSDADLAKRGANSSNIHIDWMLGSEALDVDGISDDGQREPVMRQGEWAV